MGGITFNDSSCTEICSSRGKISLEHLECSLITFAALGAILQLCPIRTWSKHAPSFPLHMVFLIFVHFRHISALRSSFCAWQQPRRGNATRKIRHRSYLVMKISKFVHLDFPVVTSLIYIILYAVKILLVRVNHRNTSLVIRWGSLNITLPGSPGVAYICFAYFDF